MAGFLYFIPKAKTFGPDDATRLELDHLPKSLTKCQVNDGPDGAGGLIMVITGKEQATAQYKAAEQEWHKQKGGDFWIGFWKENPPTPEDLLRTDSPVGVAYPLDGVNWTIPAQAALPSYMGMDKLGNWVRMVKPKHMSLQEDAEKIYQVYLGEKNDVENPLIFTEVEKCELCVRALAINYFVSKYEASILAIMTVENMVIIQQLLMDYRDLDTVDEVKKKE